MVADIALSLEMSVAPLPGGLAEEGHVQEVGFARIHGRRLDLGNRGRDERVFNGVRVDAIIDLGEGALEIPINFEAVVFFILEALELPDEVEFKFRA